MAGAGIAPICKRLRGGIPAALLLAVIVAGGTGRGLVVPAVAQTGAPSISLAFTSTDVWKPSETALSQLHDCGRPTITCVQQVMQTNGAQAEAIAFYRLTSWFLTDIGSGSPVRTGTVLNPWRANENAQPVLLGGSPSVVLPESEVATVSTDSWSSDSMFSTLKSSYPNLMFWGSGPSLASTALSPSGSQRFIFDYRMLDGCHACATVAKAQIAFDFAADGTYQGMNRLGLTPAPAADGDPVKHFGMKAAEGFQDETNATIS